MEAPVTIRPADGALAGREVIEVSRTIGDLNGIFADESARTAMPQDTLVYRVLSHCPVAEGTGGGLFFGVTFLEPGLVGDEYFMTKGHFHAKRDAAEYYWGIGGQGILLLMDEDRRCRAERIRPGSLHYVPGFTAHRTVNIGPGLLCVGACWPSEAGHDYESIARQGFSARVLRVESEAHVIEVPR
jgi:glucose-6-phosphate isomerase